MTANVIFPLLPEVSKDQSKAAAGAAKRTNAKTKPPRTFWKGKRQFN